MNDREITPGQYSAENFPFAEKPHSHAWHKIMLGTALVAGAVIVSPYLLPALGIGTSEIALNAMTSIHGASGLAGWLNAGLESVPLMGATLAKGGLATAAISGVAGMGGVLLGKFLEKKQDGTTGINWGRVIKYGALATSALIALPSVLTGISVGIIYLCGAFAAMTLAAPEAAALTGEVIAFMSKSLGAMGAMDIASLGGGIAAMLPHLLACGATILPAAFSFGLSRNDKTSHHHTAMKQQDLTNPVIATMEVDKPTQANIPCVAKLRLVHGDSGQPLTQEELAVVHTRKLHLFVVDESLRDYQHIHPEPSGEPGVLVCSFTPKTSNRYNAWADFTLLKDSSTHTLKTEIPSASGRAILPGVRINTRAANEGLLFEWSSGGPLRKDISSMVEINVTDVRGNPVTDLEPVMGVFAHLTGFSADGKTIIHSHSMGTQPASANDRGGPRLRFHVEPGCAGATQFYLQVKRNGQDMYVPFGQQIHPPLLAPQKIIAQQYALSSGYAI